MKKRSIYLILTSCIIILISAFTVLAGDKQKGTNYTSHLYDGNGNYVITQTFINCDPCGSVFRAIFGCHCGGEGVLYSYDPPSLN